MSVLLPVAFLLLQAAVLLFVPAASAPAAYLAMVAAPLLAGAAALWRAGSETPAARLGWSLVAAALLIWAAGAFGNLWQEWLLGRTGEMYRGSIFAFALAAVPTTYLLASDWEPAGRRLVHAIDAVLALALGCAYFLITWSVLTARGAPDEAGVATMVWLLDAQNLFIAGAALVRWLAADDARERALFRALTAYATLYFAIVFWNDHFVAGDPGFGPQHSSVVTLAFALLAALALRGASAPKPPQQQPRPQPQPHPALVRAVRSASPWFLAGALLVVSLLLIRLDYAAGAAGVLLAVLGYGLRSTVAQVRHIEREDRLERDRTELQAIAWTDALTGVANRRFLDHVLGGAGRRELCASQPLAVLMIDIDHFKQLNDRYGHPAGDACLRRVAQALQQALVRPGDLLARYGGEEFIAVLQEADAAGALVVAERLRAAVETLRIEHLGSPSGLLTISIGAASASLQPDESAAALVGAADKALYEAKCAGRNLVRSLMVA